jgi:molybdate transport system ATP-binding protein
MHDGRVVEEGPTRRVLERPRHPFTAELSGLTLVRGVRTPDGMRGDDGMTLLGQATERIEPGTPVLAAVRPSAVRLTAAGTGSVAATVTALEPQADLVRVRTDRLDALVAPADVADLRLRVGARVGLVVPASAVTLYPA